MEKKVLGRGINALIPEFDEMEEKGKIINLPIEKIRPNPHQPREKFDDATIDELMSSIKEKGLVQPILVRKMSDGYELIAGERRLRAAKKMQLDKIPAIVKDTDSQASLELALIENIQREDLNPLEEARAYKHLIDKFGLTQEKISQIVGKSRSSIANTLRLFNLPKEIQEAIKKEQISHAHGKVLLEVADINEQLRLLRQILSSSLSVRELESVIFKHKQTRPRKGRAHNILDHNILALQDGLQRFLGTKVRIIPRKKRGTVLIEFYSLNDLERIINIIKKN